MNTDAESQFTTESGPPRQTWQQMADEHLALENLELRERVSNLECDVLTYRECFQQAIHALHHITIERGRLRQTVRELREIMHSLPTVGSEKRERRAA